jgi:hypothetical protein
MYRTNGAFRSVLVRSGESILELSYSLGPFTSALFVGRCLPGDVIQFCPSCGGGLEIAGAQSA